MGNYTKIHPPDVCVCHGEPLLVYGTKRMCGVKQRLRTRRYQATDAGRIAKANANHRRVRLGTRHLFSAETTGEAGALNAHIKERLSEFVTRQSARAQAEGAPASAVPPQAEL